MSFFWFFWLELRNTFESDRQEIKISTHMKKFPFCVKYAVFSENQNEILKNTDFCYILFNDHIQ